MVMDTANLPALNASLNFLATCCLVSGYIAIKMKKEDLHKKLMVGALILSSIFLSGYLVYHYNHGSTRFPDLGWIKTLYLVILIPHIILAAVMVPMILMTFKYAFADEREKHRKWARITLPIWLYVSVTGVIIYFMIYHWFKV